jgi:Lhr-like helicase
MFENLKTVVIDEIHAFARESAATCWRCRCRGCRH